MPEVLHESRTKTGLTRIVKDSNGKIRILLSQYLTEIFKSLSSL